MKVPAPFRLLLVVVFVVSFFSPSLILADGDVFLEEFNDQSVDLVHWQPNPNPNGVIEGVNNENVRLSSLNGNYFPYLYMKNVQIPDSNYSIEIKFRFSGNLTYGNGLIFSDSLATNGTPSDLAPKDYIFAVWVTSPTTAAIITTLCTTNLPDCTNGTPVILSSITSTNWNTLRVDESNGHFVITVNNLTFDTKDSSRRISNIWMGNPQKTNTAQNWASINVDYLYIKDTLPLRIPVVVLPGYGGSWDIGAILAGTEGSNWAIPSFVKNYDGIVQSFKNAGFVEGTDLFVFPYDWRKPLTNLADDLNTFINSKNLADKVDLVGHSMGGLVARAYAQKYGVEKVDKILTAGSPHLGLIDMYGLWEGAKIWDGVWWQNVLLEIATEVNRLSDESKVAAIRRVSPSIIDLFPTSSFLISGGSSVEIETMVQKNSYLKTLNQDIGTLGDKLTPFWSEDVTSTKNNINVVPRSESDSAEGKWEDGRPAEGDPFGKAVGDGTVTKESAVGVFGAGEKITGWHGDLVASKNNIQKIFTKLGLDTNFATSSETDSRKKSFVAILRSPGTLEVCNLLLTNCNDQLGLYYPEFKLFILPGYNDNDLSVKVKESGLGSYKLYVGSVESEGVWKTVPGNLISSGQVDKYLVGGASMTVSPTNNSPILTTIGNKNIDEFATLNFSVEASDIDYNLTFTVSDGVFTDEETITITVKEMNNSPTPQEDKFVTNEDSDLTMSATELLANDSDPDNAHDDLVIVSVANPSHGSVLISANNIIFTPSLNYFGPAGYSYTVTDGSLTNTANVTITVNPVNDAPTAADDSITTNEDTLIDIDLSGSDIDGDSLTYAIVSGVSHGNLGAISGNQISYTPSADYQGTDSFTYKVNDGAVDSLIATVSATITSINDAPALETVGNKTINELTTLTFTVNATDPDSTGLIYSLEGAPAGATINSTTGVFTFTPTEAQGPGAYTLTIKVTDGISTDSEEIMITVNEVNVTPVAQEGSASTNEDTSKIITLVASDSDLPVNTLTYAILSTPSHGTVSLVGDQATYTPTANYHGTDSFTFEVKDSSSSSPIIFNLLGVATVSVTVNPINDAPVASDVSASTSQDNSVAIDLTGSDVDGDSLVYSIVSGVSHGTLGAISNKRLTYTPNTGYHGTDAFTFKINDGYVDGNTATVNISIDTPPLISSEAVNAPSETGVTIVWNTDHPSTSRVIYETISHPTLGDAPNYGYAHSTVEKDDSPKVTSHAVTITGLTAGTTYYYRAVSHGSPEVVGSEKSFTTKGVKPTVSFENSLAEVVKSFSQEVLGETTEATASVAPLSTPSPAVLGETQNKNEDLKWWTLSLLTVLLYFGSRQMMKRR
ncbi:MAG: VCBS repeat-containing protein [Microgenomates group bacterium GW2011_GWC1_44_23]|nr:MAG: VCBS repeat-containing protein [Microgenomates group bacterium GW2011_GWC1_44_23]